MSERVGFTGQAHLLPIAILLVVLSTAILAEAALSNHTPQTPQATRGTLYLSEPSDAAPAAQPQEPGSAVQETSLPPSDETGASQPGDTSPDQPTDPTGFAGDGSGDDVVTEPEQPPANETPPMQPDNPTEQNQTTPENQTAPELNDTASENQTIPEMNETQNQTGPLALVKQISVSLRLPQRADRMSSFVAYADITNTGDFELGSIYLEWVLPDGFSLLSKSGECTPLPPGAACAASAEIAVAGSVLGANKITARVNYG